MSVTYNFSPNTRIKSAEVNQNFNDIIVTEWTSYQPTFYAETGTWTSITTWIARYTQIRKIVFVQVHVSGTTAGGCTALGCSLPIVPAQVSAVPDVASGALVISNGGAGYFVGISNYDTAQAKVLVRRETAAPWTNADSNGFTFQLFYEVA